MKTCSRIAIYAFCLLMFAGGAQAQSRFATLSASLDPASVKPGDHATLKIEFEVKTGFHAQSHKPLDKNYIATVVKLEDNPSISAGETVYPAGQNENYPAL
jgi:hypothetical protein